MRKYFSQEERDAYNAQKREEANQQIVDLAKTWQDNPEDVAEFIRFQSRFHHYSARNKLLIYKQKPVCELRRQYGRFQRNGLLRASWTARNEYFRVCLSRRSARSPLRRGVRSGRPALKKKKK